MFFFVVEERGFGVHFYAMDLISEVFAVFGCYSGPSSWSTTSRQLPYLPGLPRKGSPDVDLFAGPDPLCLK